MLSALSDTVVHQLIASTDIWQESTGSPLIRLASQVTLIRPDWSVESSGDVMETVGVFLTIYVITLVVADSS